MRSAQVKERSFYKKNLCGHQKNAWFFVEHKKISTSLAIGFKYFFALLIIIVLKLEKKCHFYH
jgi:hypothetical protein